MVTSNSPRHPVRARTRGLALSLLALACAGTAQADAVTDWNEVMGRAVPAIGGAPQRVYVGAMVHVAIHDALNAIRPRYESYNVIPAANPLASPNAAIAAAARGVLMHELSRAPDSPLKAEARAMVQAEYVAALTAIPNGARQDMGVAVGRSAAAAIIAARRGDGSDTPNLPYTWAPARGVYQPTPPALAPPTFAGWALLKPFVLESASQFRAPPGRIFNLKGDAYTRDYNEVKRVGDARVRSAAPNSEFSRIARFWPGGGQDWSSNVRVIVADRNLDRWQHARLFALVELAQADAAVSLFESKYTYNFWRPVTAIRWMRDGNPNTTPDPDWLPYIATPPYPDYPCGLPNLAGAATEVMRRYFGTDLVPFTRTVTIVQPPPAAPDVITRYYPSLSQAANETALARVYSGIHFRESCRMAVRQGTKVGTFVFENSLRRLPAKAVAAD